MTNNSNPRPDSASVLRKVMPPKVLVSIAMISFGLSVVFLAIASFDSQLFPTEIGRFFLIVLVSFTLAIFLFLLFPGDFQMTRVPGIDLGIKLAGPIVLFFITFLFLRAYMPQPPSGRLFFAFDGGRPNMQPFEGFTVTPRGKYELYGVIPLKRDPPRELVGVYVPFKDPTKDPVVEADVKLFGTVSAKTVSFDLNTTNPIFEIRETDKDR